MKTLYFLRGLPASGKTTWAKAKLAALNVGGKTIAIRTNKDEIREQLGGIVESKVIRKETELVTEALKAGRDVIVDNTHFNPHHERRYRLLAEKYGYRFELKSFIHVPLEECIRRDQNRPNSVGEAVIRRMHAQYLVLKPEAHPNTRARLLQWPR
jgi:predicted kinase